MPTTEAQRAQLFAQLCEETDKKVREVHKGTSGTDFSLSAIEGWLRNQWNRKTTLADVGTYIAQGGVRLVAWFLSSVPGLGTLLTISTDQYLALARRKHDEFAIQVGAADPDQRGTFLVEHGMQAYVDALRKAHQAEIDYNRVGYGNCREFTEKIARLYYWKYRLERLHYYHAILLEYLKHGEGVLATAEQSCKNCEQTLRTKGPDIYQDWTWHRTQCKDFCTFPWETLEISGPTNVVKHSMLQAGPNAGKPVKVVPTGKNALPLPPRPPHLYKK
jgi:hypothetical protein